MTGTAQKMILELEDWVEQDVEAVAVDGETTAQTAARIVTEWATLRRSETPEFVTAARAAIAEGRADPRPAHPADEVFDRLEAKYAAMAAADDGER